MAGAFSRGQAEQLVKDIAKEHGYLSPELLQQLSPSHRREIEEALLKKDLMIGSSVMTLAKNLYTKTARFVFELLQNTDDNNYTRARAAGALPRVSFQVYPGRIIIDCNEDGFTRENLEAICAVGKSSKCGAQGYIGEKGIGFKSVFMAAWKVHIQSGPFSFSFTHRNGDSGMGMISPVWETVHDDLVSPLTRITLYLHDSGDSNLAERMRQSTREQFEELQETILLFLKNIAKLDVLFYDVSGILISSTEYSVNRLTKTDAILCKTRTVNGSTQVTKSRFHVSTHQVTNLAKNENRSYSDKEDSARLYATSEVVVAFPMTDSGAPIVKPQDLFVFLPVRRVGFNFIIQADFVTDASRQDVVADSPRNIGLIQGIAEAFVQGIVQLSGSSGTGSSVYEWMRYLPRKSGQHRDYLWSLLVDKIAVELSRVAVLLGRKQSERRLICELLRPTEGCLDEDGEPVFYGSQPKQMISRKYQDDDLDILKEYGLRDACIDDYLGWLKEDLRRGTVGRMQSPTTTESWHTQVANTLCHYFEIRKMPSCIHNLKLLPLNGGTWVQPSKSIYFAQINELNIPPDIDLQLISPDVTDSKRKDLFQFLGVGEASISDVQDLIFSKYSTKNKTEAISFATSKQHLQFLYLTDHLMSDSQRDKYTTLRVVSQEGDLVPGVAAYKHDTEPYGATELFKETVPGPNPGSGAPGYKKSSFVDEEYFRESPSTPKEQKLSWLSWFYNCVGVNSYVKLVSEGKLLSPGLYVHKHRPEKFLGALKVDYELSSGFDDNSISLLRETNVLCQGFVYTKLWNAFYPTAELLKRVGKLVEPGAFFPWLYLEDTETHDAVPTDWKEFLKVIGITAPTDLDFSLEMLRYSQYSFPKTATSSSRSKLFDLYEHIFTRQSEASEDPEAATKVQNIFNKQRCIYVPTDAGGHTWAFPDECVWNAPQKLQTKYALQLLYGPCLREDNKDGILLLSLFQNTLGIGDCIWETLIEELKDLKATKHDDIDTLVPIYKALDTQRKLKKDHEVHIKLAFESDALIYAPSDGNIPWHSVAQCIWSTGVKMRGRASLNDHYEKLHDFFVEFLGVKPVDLEMAITELTEIGNDAKFSANFLKQAIWMVNSQLSSTKRPPSSEDVVGANIFPIKMPNGQITRGSADMEFCIVDHESLGRDFAEKVRLLDFTLEEVSRLYPFLSWAHLQDRCLSKSVKEVTSFHDERTRLVSNKDRQICNRAFALLRIARHFRSARIETKEDVQALYGVLQSSKVYETSGISSDFQLTQDGTIHVVAGAIATLHIDEASSGLKIYLPRNKDDQAFVFVTTLGEKLFEWMMQQPGTKIPATFEVGVKATQAVLMAPRSRTYLVLEKIGIAPINDVENTDEQVDSEPESAASTPQLQAATVLPLVGEDGSADDETILPQPSSSGGQFTSITERHQNPQTRPTAFGRLPITAPTTPESGIVTRDGEAAYTDLLDWVIRAAEENTIPANGSFDMCRLLASIADLGLNVARSPIDRDCRVGAAGELYIFELLSGLQERLPGFCRDNWQSNMRRYVTVHPKYADMGPWSGYQTSDIIYEDTAGVLTSLLVQQGYLDQYSWSGKTPRYFIEVKTTTSHCDTPFFMSKAQYKMMQDNTLTPANRSTIYIVFRVYNLGLANMGLAVYVDPEALRVANQLEFIGENWTVVPRQEA